jgi:hypothetical protein
MTRPRRARSARNAPAAWSARRLIASVRPEPRLLTERADSARGPRRDQRPMRLSGGNDGLAEDRQRLCAGNPGGLHVARYGALLRRLV